MIFTRPTDSRTTLSLYASCLSWMYAKISFAPLASFKHLRCVLQDFVKQMPVLTIRRKKRWCPSQHTRHWRVPHRRLNVHPRPPHNLVNTVSSSNVVHSSSDSGCRRRPSVVCPLASQYASCKTSRSFDHSYSATSCLLLPSVHNSLLDDMDVLVSITAATCARVPFLSYCVSNGCVFHVLNWTLSLPRFHLHMTRRAVHICFFYRFFPCRETLLHFLITKKTSVILCRSVQHPLLLNRCLFFLVISEVPDDLFLHRHPRSLVIQLSSEFFRLTFWSAPSSAFELYIVFDQRQFHPTLVCNTFGSCSSSHHSSVLFHILDTVVFLGELLMFSLFVFFFQ